MHFSPHNPNFRVIRIIFYVPLNLDYAEFTVIPDSTSNLLHLYFIYQQLLLSVLQCGVVRGIPVVISWPQPRWTIRQKSGILTGACLVGHPSTTTENAQVLAENPFFSVFTFFVNRNTLFHNLM